MSHNVEVVEAYRNYKPPRWVCPTTKKILNTIDPKYLGGLKTVVLRNADGLNHDRRRGKTLYRKKKVQIKTALGLYHQKWNGELAWIEIFVDNIENSLGKCIWIPLFRDIEFGGILTHEIGHHVHKTIKKI